MIYSFPLRTNIICYIFTSIFNSKEKFICHQVVRLEFLNHNLEQMKLLVLLLLSLPLCSQCDVNIQFTSHELIEQMNVELLDDCDSNASWFSDLKLYQCGSGTLIIMMTTKLNIFKFKPPSRDAYDDWCMSSDKNEYYQTNVRGSNEWSFVKLSRCRHTSNGGRHCSNVVELNRGRCKQHNRG